MSLLYGGLIPFRVITCKRSGKSSHRGRALSKQLGIPRSGLKSSSSLLVT